MNTRYDNETIAAIASALGGAVAVIRVSGAGAVTVADRCWSGSTTVAEAPSRKMLLGRIRDEKDAFIDQVMIVKFVAPASYTGEDMVEIHCHGGPLSARDVLLQLLTQGARHAEPGEFTKRAFLNGKMDLTQAEAVADIINAHSRMALHLANRQLSGSLGNRLGKLREKLVDVLSETESRLDFPEENLAWQPEENVRETLQSLRSEIRALLDNRREGEILRQGVRVVIAGPPNAGKSSLLNNILGRERAIVTHIPGTTRDTLEELAHIRGIPVRLIDTAGIREAENLVEKTGIERSVSSITTAQIVLWVCDVEKPLAEQTYPYTLEEAPAPVVQVINKCDKLPEWPREDDKSAPDTVYISASEGKGMEQLFDAVEIAVWNNPHQAEPETAVSARQAALLDTAEGELQEGIAHCRSENWELLALNLRTAVEAIGKITGHTASPDILENIFSRFCIGK
ncbi:MAG: tRNA uridine-5-carboxymethylaminomethyl(34) synthesis GTPase MnmE [Verrucomicrobiota bacterium]